MDTAIDLDKELIWNPASTFYGRVCMIDTEEKRIKALQLTPVGEIWGIGRKKRKMLEYYESNSRKKRKAQHLRND
jgi:hypothetical protein